MRKNHQPLKGAHLTPSQKAEAAALWRAGSVTLDDLAKRFNKRPETFSRLFKRMNIKKGEAALEVARRAAEVVEQQLTNSVEEHARKIAKVRDEHERMSSGIAKLAWTEIVRARQANLDIGKLKDTMTVLKLASDIVGQARKEMWAILNVEEADKSREMEDLPELLVRELTPDEATQLAAQSQEDELGGDLDDVSVNLDPDAAA
jgi:hypothetical protein